MPKVSIVMPTYNGHKFINRALKSAFEQTFSDWEIVIIDDGSEPAIRSAIRTDYLEDPRLRIFENGRNLGIQKSLNRGLAEAEGEYIARLDDDDWWNCKNKLEKQVALMDREPGIGICGTGAIIVDDRGRKILKYRSAQSDRGIRRKILKKNPYVHASVVFRRNLALEVGGYGETEDVRHLEDYDLWLRIGRRAKLASLGCYCTSFLLGGSSISAKHKREQLAKNTQLVRQYGKSYPGYLKYFLFSHLRGFLYNFYSFLPSPLKRAAFTIYKKT